MRLALSGCCAVWEAKLPPAMPRPCLCCAKIAGCAAVSHLQPDQFAEALVALPSTASAAAGRFLLEVTECCARAAAAAARLSGMRQRMQGRCASAVQRCRALSMDAFVSTPACILTMQTLKSQRTRWQLRNGERSRTACNVYRGLHVSFHRLHHSIVDHSIVSDMLARKAALLDVLLLLLAVGAAGASVNQANCDRYRSRKAQVVVRDYILPRAEKLGYTLPEGCLVHPKRNMCVRALTPCSTVRYWHHNIMLRKHATRSPDDTDISTQIE